MVRSVRLIPVTMTTAFLLLGLKVGEVMRDGHAIAVSFSTEAHAQQPAPTPAADAGTTPGAAPTANATAPATAPAADASTKPADGSKPADDKTAAGAKPDDKTSLKEAAAAGVTGGDDSDEEEAKHEFSQVEIDLLQSLAKRRQELDDWAKQVQLKENMLVAIEGRIDEKTSNLEKMKKEVETLLAKYNEQEDIKTRSLVKIYESMKPKDAARIFEELDMPVLLMVVDRMSERKVAAILENMNPSRAKDITVQLAEERKLQKMRGGPTPPATPPATGR